MNYNHNGKLRQRQSSVITHAFFLFNTRTNNYFCAQLRIYLKRLSQEQFSWEKVNGKKLVTILTVGIIVGFYVTKKPTTLSTAAHTITQLFCTPVHNQWNYFTNVMPRINCGRPNVMRRKPGLGDCWKRS